MISMIDMSLCAFLGGLAGALLGARRVARLAVEEHEKACVVARMYEYRPNLTPPPTERKSS